MSQLWDGVVEMRQVGMVEGLQWIAPLTEQSQCHIRRASFSLAAGDPCMYTRGTSATVSATADAEACYGDLPLAEGKPACRPRCYDIPALCRTVSTFSTNLMNAAPIVTLSNESDAAVPPLRLVAYADPGGIGVSPNPCGLPILGELYTRIIPPWSTITWDVLARCVTVEGAVLNGLSGFAFVDANDPPERRWFVLPCGQSHIVMEPANWCLEVDTPNTRYLFEGQSFLWADLHFPTMTVEIAERRGCA